MLTLSIERYKNFNIINKFVSVHIKDACFLDYPPGCQILRHKAFNAQNYLFYHCWYKYTSSNAVWTSWYILPYIVTRMHLCPQFPAYSLVFIWALNGQHCNSTAIASIPYVNIVEPLLAYTINKQKSTLLTTYRVCNYLKTDFPTKQYLLLKSLWVLRTPLYKGPKSLSQWCLP